MAGIDYSPDTLLLAMIADNLSTLVWIESGSAHQGGARPKSMVELITGGGSGSPTQAFASGDDFQAAREKILRGE